MARSASCIASRKEKNSFWLASWISLKVKVSIGFEPMLVERWTWVLSGGSIHYIGQQRPPSVCLISHPRFARSPPIYRAHAFICINTCSYSPHFFYLNRLGLQIQDLQLDCEATFNSSSCQDYTNTQIFIIPINIKRTSERVMSIWLQDYICRNSPYIMMNGSLFDVSINRFGCNQNNVIIIIANMIQIEERDKNKIKTCDKKVFIFL